MSQLSISVLGEFRVLIDDSPVSSFESDKARALLVYLVVEADRSHQRETLIGLLWPDCPEQVARHNLRQALFNLRKAIGDHNASPPYLLITRDTIQINRESDYSLDLDHFNIYYSAWEKDREDGEPLKSISMLEEMVRLYRGEFLQLFYLEGSAEYEEWILVQREALHQQMMNALTILANEYELRGEFQAVRRYALRQLELDPWWEEAHCQIMRVLALNGQRSAALAQYEICRKVLAEELGVEPSPMTRDLYEQIRLGSLKPKAELPTSISSTPFYNLPPSLTPFIGREQELTELAVMITESEYRCITLLGPGGIGKTRLALQAAHQHTHEFSQGSAYIPLDSIGSIEAVIPAIANAIDCTFYGPTHPKIQLLYHLRDKQMLLIIDNVEHLLIEEPRSGTIVDLLIEILQQCAQIKLLVTSREALNLQGESIFEVQGLAFPDQEQTEGLEEYSAIALFLQRARRARPGFELNDEYKKGVVRLCQLVGGLPLAIELAATWVRILSPEEIANEIETSLDFLNSHMRDLPERHRSMRVVFDHSWQMLTEEEQRVLSRASVFRRGFTREAVEAVAGANLVLLSALLAKSLLSRTSGRRYGMHELVNQYVAGRLAQVPEQEREAREQHSAYFADYVARLEGELKGAGQLQARKALDAEIDNIRTGWRWAVQQGQTAMVRKSIRTLWYFYNIRGWFQEAEASFTWATEKINTGQWTDDGADGCVGVLREYLRALLGWFSLRRGKLELAEMLLQSSLAALRSFAISIELADILYYAGAAAWMSGDYPRAHTLWLEELAVAEQVGAEWDVGLATINLGLLAQTIGEYEEAQQRWQTALAIYRRLGDQHFTAEALLFYGILKRILGSHAEAESYFRESMTFGAEAGERWIYGMALSQLGEVAHAQGDDGEAVRLLNKGVILLRELGEHWSMLHALIGLGAATLATGDYSASHAAYSEALTMAWERQALPEVLEAMTGMARWSAHQGAVEQALLSTLFILNHQAVTYQTKEIAHQLRVELESGLSPDQIRTAQQLARSKTMGELVHQFSVGI